MSRWMLVLALGLVAAGCNDVETPEALPGNGDDPATLQLVAENEQFDPTELTAPANEAFVIEIDNRDTEEPHNISIHTDDAYTDNVYRGDLFTGPDVQEEQVPALSAGTYHFRCDVHPEMTGTIAVG